MYLGGLFRVDLPGDPVTLEGRLHLGAAQTSGAAVGALAIALAISSRRHPEWAHFPRTTVLIGLVGMPFVLLFLSGVVPGMGGVWQRIFFAVTLVWVQMASLRVYWLAGGDLWPPSFWRRRHAYETESPSG